MTLINSTISGSLNIRTNLRKLTMHKTDFHDIIVAENVTINDFNISEIDGSLEIGNLTNYGKYKNMQ